MLTDTQELNYKQPMGFNIGIGAINKKNQIDTSCDNFLDRSYYNLISEYIYEEKEESCLYHIFIGSKIDIQPLTNIVYLEEDDFTPSNLYSTRELIDLVAKLKKHIETNKSTILKSSNEKVQKRKKYIDRELEIHLELIAASLKCFEEKKYAQVFFWYA